MSDRAQLIAVILLVGAFVAGYAVCRRPESGPRVSSEQPPGGEAATTTAAEDWSPKLIGDPRLREAVEQLNAQWEKLQAVSVSLKTKMPEAAGMEGETEGLGQYSMQRSEGVQRTRFRIFNSLVMPREDKSKLVTGEEIIQNFDGKHLWLYLNQPGNQTVTKAVYDPERVFHVGGPDLFASIFKDSDVELVGDEKVGEWDTYVIISKPRSGGWSTKYWFDKATGVQVKLVETTAAGVDQLTMITDAIDTNPQFAADRFEMKAPERFKLIDETEK